MVGLSRNILPRCPQINPSNDVINQRKNLIIITTTWLRFSNLPENIAIGLSN